METQRRLAIDPQDLAAIMDQLAEKRDFTPRGLYRSLVTGDRFAIGVMDDGAVVSLPIE
jgi:hypothetical protein